MEKTEEILEKIKNLKDSRVNEIVKDIVLIDGAIVEDDVNYKEKNVFLLEKKYKEKLDLLSYGKVKEDVKDKIAQNVESKIKYYNTKLGTIKVFLIRIAGIEVVGENYINEEINKLKKEQSKDNIYKLLEMIDDILVKHI